VATATAKRQLQYVLIPHPDDELQGWSLVEGAQDNYPVFVLLTHGEGTAMGDGHGLDVAAGERTPQPQPFHGPRSAFLHAQRLDSWHAFLDAMAGVDPTLDIPHFHGHLTGAAPPPGGAPGGFDVFVGARTARVVFDLGDGHLGQEVVAWALRTVRSQVRPLLPVQQEHGVIGAAYFNTAAGAPFYDHVDHRAVHLALWHVDFGLPGPQWCRTSHVDPDVAATGGRTESMSPATYAAATEIGPNGERIGHYQRAYGWLAFDPAGWFPPADRPEDDGAVSRYQSFWRRF
jgi:hypothetical protein